MQIGRRRRIRIAFAHCPRGVRQDRPAPWQADHTACFGACHGAPPAETPARSARVDTQSPEGLCESCHAELLLAAPLVPCPFPAVTRHNFRPGARDKRHWRARARNAAFLQGNGARRPARAGSRAAINSMTAWHLAAGGAPQPQADQSELDRRDISRTRVAARSRDRPRVHNVPRANQYRPTQPTTSPDGRGLRALHDGTRAFAACTRRCHAEPTRRFDVAPPRALSPSARAGWSPTGRAQRAARSPRTATQPRPATRVCHAHTDDFGAREPTLQHVPSGHRAVRRAHLHDRPSPGPTEFGATARSTPKHPGDHALHAGNKGEELQMPRRPCRVRRRRVSLKRRPLGGPSPSSTSSRHAARCATPSHVSRTAPPIVAVRARSVARTQGMRARARVVSRQSAWRGVSEAPRATNVRPPRQHHRAFATYTKCSMRMHRAPPRVSLMRLGVRGEIGSAFAHGGNSGPVAAARLPANEHASVHAPAGRVTMYCSIVLWASVAPRQARSALGCAPLRSPRPMRAPLFQPH